MLMRIQLQPVNISDLALELEDETALLNQLQIDLKNAELLDEQGWKVFDAMRQELERIWHSVISDEH